MRSRLIVALLFFGACSDSTGTQIDGAPPSDAIVIDAAPVDALMGIGTVGEIATLPTPPGGATPFLEGPVWRAGEGTLLFSDIPNSTIHELALPASIAEFRQPSGKANGLVLDHEGLLLAAEHEGRRVSRTLANGQVVAVAELFEGKRLHSPNDLVVRGDGTIYFTDPPYGGNPAELDFNGLFRVAPDDSVVAEVRFPSVARPNGVGLSPDGRTLYVADTTGTMRAYDVGDDGSLSGERIFNDQLVAGADGMAIDREGNVWVTTSDGIDVFAPDGRHWGTVAVPKQPANCAFGGADGKTLFITARDSLYRVDVEIPGLGF